MRKTNINILLRLSPVFIPIVFLVYSCANVVTPMGGEKDIAAPTIDTTKPPNNSVNFSGNKILIMVSEMITLIDPQKNIVSSPPFRIPPNIKLKKNRNIEITLKDSLLPNTTYIFQFIGAMKDITENNKLDLYQYVFSTGNIIDSMTLSGNVKDAFIKLNEDAWVVLYPETSADSMIYTDLPVYVSKTDEKGNFKLEYLRRGKYKLVAIQDKNNNLKLDGVGEKIAFQNELIEITDSTEKQTLYLFKELLKTQKARVVGSTNKMIKIAFNFPPAKVSFHKISNNFDLAFTEFLAPDSVIYWLKEEIKDSITAKIITPELTDNIKVFHREGKDKSLKLKIEPAIKSTQKRTSEFIDFKTNFPINRIDKEAFKLIEDSVLLKDSLKILFNDKIKRIFKVGYLWKPDKNYQLIIYDKAIQSIYNQYNDNISVNFKIKNDDEFGILDIEVEPLFNPKGMYIMELLDNEGRMCKKEVFSGSKKLHHNYILPGQYQISIINDINLNGRWDTGDYIKKRQPEDIYYYPENIELRANWTMEVKVVVDQF
jgi:uncharacterized protein (DUF2141 family)